MAEPYRSGYRVEDHVREPTAGELTLIRQRREEERQIHRKNQLGGSREAFFMAGVAVIVGAVGYFIDQPAVIIGGALVAALLGTFAWIGYRKGEQRLAARRGRWGAPDPEWRVHETRIVARSAIHAVSDDEDYVTWVIYEIPGGEWAAIDDLWVPPEARDDLTRSDLRFTWLEPNHECLKVEASGDPLPRHGALRLGERGYDGDDFAEAVEQGFVWSDEELLEEAGPGAEPIRRVPEAAMPEWMREAVGSEK